ncbi:hypothetical protein DSL72_000438 [Monilinia vaccinii-corymbosi]|uniref:Uncharacterized protein n=1 Tax=Monilinia vaccinii-corymbosi TaxID=61207 RepID=A0A8A3P2X5_9HELO|nr:hypothetical protein DSL72_000438 [Monilinia vaccinii-corymbosi]
MDDSTILVLWEADGECNLLGIPYNIGGGAHVKYQPHRISACRSKATILSNKEVVDRFLQNKFSDERQIAPGNMMVRPQIGSKRNEDMKRLVILAKDRFRYKVFKWAGAPTDKNADEDILMS